MYHVLYACRRHYLGSFNLFYALLSLGGLGAVLIGLGVTPWPSSLGIPVALLPLLVLVLDFRARRQHYVHFTADGPQAAPAPLAPGRKLRMRATGWFEVEDKHQIHVWLEGYYRTFPTREHAVIALCAPTSLWGWGRSRSQDDGMWYMFIRPADVLEVQTGNLRFGQEQMAGVQLVHRALVPGKIRPQRLRQQNSVTLLGFPSSADALLAAGDLLYDIPRHSLTNATPPTANGSK